MCCASSQLVASRRGLCLGELSQLHEPENQARLTFGMPEADHVETMPLAKMSRAGGFAAALWWLFDREQKSKTRKAAYESGRFPCIQPCWRGQILCCMQQVGWKAVYAPGFEKAGDGWRIVLGGYQKTWCRSGHKQMKAMARDNLS